MRLTRTLSYFAIAAMQIVPAVAFAVDKFQDAIPQTLPSNIASKHISPMAVHKSKEILLTAAVSDSSAPPPKNTSSRRNAAERGLAFENRVEIVDPDRAPQTTTNEIVVRQVEPSEPIAVSKIEKKNTVTIYEPESNDLQEAALEPIESEENKIVDDGALTPAAPMMNPWPKQTPVTAHGAISDVDPNTGTADLRFTGRHRLRVGMKLHIFQKYLLSHAMVGDVEVVLTGPKNVIVRPLDGAKLAKLSPGDEVMVDSRPLRQSQGESGNGPSDQHSSDAARMSSRPQSKFRE